MPEPLTNCVTNFVCFEMIKKNKYNLQTKQPDTGDTDCGPWLRCVYQWYHLWTEIDTRSRDEVTVTVEKQNDVCRSTFHNARNDRTRATVRNPDKTHARLLFPRKTPTVRGMRTASFRREHAPAVVLFYASRPVSRGKIACDSRATLTTRSLCLQKHITRHRPGMRGHDRDRVTRPGVSEEGHTRARGFPAARNRRARHCRTFPTAPCPPPLPTLTPHFGIPRVDGRRITPLVLRRRNVRTKRRACVIGAGDCRLSSAADLFARSLSRRPVLLLRLNRLLLILLLLRLVEHAMNGKKISLRAGGAYSPIRLSPVTPHALLLL